MAACKLHIWQLLFHRSGLIRAPGCAWFSLCCGQLSRGGALLPQHLHTTVFGMARWVVCSHISCFAYVLVWPMVGSTHGMPVVAPCMLGPLVVLACSICKAASCMPLHVVTPLRHAQANSFLVGLCAWHSGEVLQHVCCVPGTNWFIAPADPLKRFSLCMGQSLLSAGVAP
jgi:hypothetical protein